MTLDKERLTRMWHEGVPVRVIASKMKVSPSTISVTAARLGLISRRVGDYSKCAYDGVINDPRESAYLRMEANLRGVSPRVLLQGLVSQVLEKRLLDNIVGSGPVMARRDA